MDPDTGGAVGGDLLRARAARVVDGDAGALGDFGVEHAAVAILIGDDLCGSTTATAHFEEAAVVLTDRTAGFQRSDFGLAGSHALFRRGDILGYGAAGQ